jgi:ADP-ribosyl-[dinitrogen reductase] hydrolase
MKMTTRRQWFTKTEQQRALGLMLGAAIGDALGAPFEFGEAGDYRRRFPEPVLGGRGEMIGGGAFGWEPGEFTDDTQMALVLAEAILRSSGYDPDTVWTWFRTWSASAADVGNQTRSSLRHADWRDVPRNMASSAGNGALMRSFPLALAFLDASDTVVRDVVLHQAALTHPDPAAGWGSGLAVEMMRAAVLGNDPFDRLDDCLDQLPDDVRDTFAATLQPGWTPDQPAPSNGSVWGCLAQAVWAVRTTTSFADALVAAIGLGGDTDTVACVAGALAGARYGIQGIPSRWATYVHGRVDTPEGPLEYRMDHLQQMTYRLIGVDDRPETTPEPPAGPVEVAPSLHAADLVGANGVPTDWAVVSLCRTRARFDAHPVRRQVFLIDEPHRELNPDLAHAVRDAVDAVDAFLAEGRQVVVHCHGGRSRTGLVLKAWAMRNLGFDERGAHEWLEDLWFRYEDYNDRFVDFLQHDWQWLAR